jgi:hypothetical protein
MIGNSLRSSRPNGIDERSIVRTWPMRGTLHFVAATDVRWMLRLLTPRVIKGWASRMRHLEIEDGELVEESVDGVSYIVSRDAFDVSAAARRSTRALHLLPGFDEYMLGYTDRRIALDLVHAQRIVPGNNGVFMPTIVARGRVIGTWRAAVARRSMAVMPDPFVPLSAGDARAFAAAARRYEQFVQNEE